MVLNQGERKKIYEEDRARRLEEERLWKPIRVEGERLGRILRVVLRVLGVAIAVWVIFLIVIMIWSAATR